MFVFKSRFKSFNGLSLLTGLLRHVLEMEFLVLKLNGKNQVGLVSMYIMEENSS